MRPSELLTPRQLESLDALIQHGSDKGAARALGITPRGFENNMAKVRERLGTHTIGACVLRALEKVEP